MYEARKRPIDYTGFKFASAAGAGIPTAAHLVFKKPVSSVRQLHNQIAEPIMGDGDGTALLQTQLED